MGGRVDPLRAHATVVAPRILGSVIESGSGAELVAVRITEVEAYGGIGEDPGSHAFRRQTPRNATMFLGAGHLYCYFTYGMHHCVNIVTGVAGTAGAVLLRAGEVIEGVEIARRRRPAAARDTDLARGPARLAVVLAADRSVDGIDLRAPGVALRWRPRRCAPGPIEVTTRTGVSGPGAALPWRFAISGDPTVSRHRPVAPRNRSGGTTG